MSYGPRSSSGERRGSEQAATALKSSTWNRLRCTVYRMLLSDWFRPHQTVKGTLRGSARASLHVLALRPLTARLIAGPWLFTRTSSRLFAPRDEPQPATTRHQEVTQP